MATKTKKAELAELPVEMNRLNDEKNKNAPWKKWGPYLSERQWGTVREDYSENGDAWNFFTRVHTAGVKRVLPVFRITSKTCALPWPCGTAGILYSKSVFSDSRTARATMERM
jgi:hypothetical protein